MLQTSIQLFKNAELFELALLAGNIQIAFYQKQSNYEKLVEIYSNLQATSRQLVEIVKKNNSQKTFFSDSSKF